MKLIIIGGGAGGPASASRARRLDENAEIIMLERGEHISYGHCGLPYYIGGVIQNRGDLLLSNPEKFKQTYNVNVRVRSLVKNIFTDTKEIEVLDFNTGDSYRESYDKLILSTGSDPIKPPLPGLELDGIFTLRNLTDADKINQYINDRKPRKVAVIGGGFIGLEMAENFVHRGMEVTIVEMLDQVMPPLDREMAEPIHRTLMLHGVNLAFSDPVAGFAKENNSLKVALKSGKEIACDMIILSIGVRPNLELARLANIELGKIGGIKVNERMQTSNPNIYAVGDGVETKNLVTGEPALIPLAGPAARQARIAVGNIFGRDEKYKGTLGTSLVKVFEATVGTVGASEKLLKKIGMKYQKCYFSPFSHITYYPNAASMNFKLIFSPDDGKILGAQIVGTEGVDKRIDTLATAISAGMTVSDLTSLELGYVPQLGSAKEAVNIGGYIASNMLKGDMPFEHWDNLQELMSGNGIFLDVREETVTGIGMIPDSKNIPLSELRNRINELPKDVPIYIYCNVGVESYIATRMLKLNGFDARNMSGGYTTYKNIHKPVDTSESIDPIYEKADEPVEATSQPEDATCLDACGLQCPGPILKVKQKMDELAPGSVLEVTANDTGFAIDLPAWCRSTGNEVLSVEVKDGKIVGKIRKKGASIAEQPKPSAIQANSPKEKTIVVFSNDMDRVMSAFIIANGSAAMGSKVNLFFTFWGLNVLRKPQKVSVSKSFIERMFGKMMPRGTSKLTLSKLNMGGMGTRMMKMVMKQKNVNTIDELIKSAIDQGVRIIACTMTMNIMGLRKEELIDGIEEGGVAAFLEDADHSNMTLFI